MGAIIQSTDVAKAKSLAGLQLSGGPLGQDWKKRNDAAMVPDKGFVKQLKKLKSSYEVVWDWGLEKWQIWDFDKEGEPPVFVCTVQTKDKSYRELGEDVLINLRRFENFSVKQLCDYFEELDNQVRRRKMQDFLNHVGSIARETFLNIHCMMIQVPREFAIQRGVKGDDNG